MNEKQQAALDAINNFILWYTSDETEREEMSITAWEYVTQDHVLTGDDNV